MELVPARLQFDAQLLEIVNLAVEDDEDLAGLVRHWLMPVRRQVDDGKPAMTERNRAVGVLAFTVRAAMADAIGHAFEQLGRNRFAAPIDNTDYAAHDESFHHVSPRRKQGILMFLACASG
jgi:hypothetical protein